MHPNAQVVKKAFEAFVRGDVEAFTAELADDVVFHMPGSNQLSGDYKGKDEFVTKVVGRILELTGGTLALEAHDIFGSDDHAVGIYVIRAERDGKRYEWKHVNVYHIREGKAAEIWWNPFEQDVVDELLA